MLRLHEVDYFILQETRLVQWFSKESQDLRGGGMINGKGKKKTLISAAQICTSFFFFALLFIFFVKYWRVLPYRALSMKPSERSEGKSTNDWEQLI